MRLKAVMVKSTKKDCRGEYESSAVIELNGIKTRVACRVLVLKKVGDEIYFLAKKFRSGFFLPGGGFDAEKDLCIADSAKRELLEEAGIIIKDITVSEISWYHTENSKEANWVKKYVPEETSRWHAYLDFFVLANYEGESDTEKEECCNKWYPITDILNAKSGKALQYVTEAKKLGYLK